MKRLTTLLTAFNLLAIGCSSMPERPDADDCVVNVPALHEKCYNLKRDYDDNGMLLPGAKPTYRQYKTAEEMLAALSKRITFDPSGWANVKAYIRELRAAVKQPLPEAAGDDLLLKLPEPDEAK